jgi:hypothetical protein
MTKIHSSVESFLRSSNSTVEFDALLEVPTAFQGALNQLALPQTQDVLRQRGRRRMLSLEGDTFRPDLLNMNRVEFLAPGQTSPYPLSSVSTMPMFEMVDRSGCWNLSTTAIALLDYMRANATQRLINSTSLLVDFDPIPTTDRDGSLWTDNHTYAAVLRSMRSDDGVLTITVADRCVNGRRKPAPLVMKFLRIDTPTSPLKAEPAFQVARNTLGVVQLVTAVNAGGALAVAGARSGVVLELFTCYPDFADRLGVMDSPFQISLGTEQYNQYLGASTMNHLFIYGLPALHALIGVVYSRVRCASIWDGFVWARFPSLSLLPVQYLIQTTAQSATITVTAAVNPWDRAIAGISLGLVVAPVVALLVYLTRTWGPRCIRGVNPITLARRESRKRPNFDPHLDRPLELKIFVEEATERRIQRLQSKRARLGLVVKSIFFFIDGDIKWKDSEDCRPGYCRASRILFMDYTPSAYWFMSVELGVAFLMGILGGIKVGTCDTVAVALLVVLVLFLATILVLQPYNTVFGVYFNILVTVLQVFGASFAVIALSRDGADLIIYQQRSELMSFYGLYLLVGKAVLDLLPKLRDVLFCLYRLARSLLGSLKTKERSPNAPSASGSGGTHDDLTEKLLQTIQASSAADANWVSSINALTPAAEQHDGEHNDEVGLFEAVTADALFAVPPPNSRHEEENWGYEWDQSALGPQAPILNASSIFFLLDDGRDGVSLLNRLPPTDFNRGGERSGAEGSEEEADEDVTASTSSAYGQRSLLPLPRRPRLDLIPKPANRLSVVPVDIAHDLEREQFLCPSHQEPLRGGEFHGWL